MNVAVLGASNKPERYSYKAVALLRDKGHVPFPVHPAITDVAGIPAYPSILKIPEPIDTISIYMSAKNQQAVADTIIKSGARRVIFNPGAENPELADRLRRSGIESLEACTLVMLKTGQF